jgi:hypothetical protein
VNQAARHIGKTIALVLPVVLVLSGTLAVTRVPWAPSGSEAQVLTASSRDGRAGSSDAVQQTATPQAALRQRLLNELQSENPGVALTHLQQEMARRPSLAKHCASIARALGRATVAFYGGNTYRAQKWARPVCDTSFATGVLSAP